MRNLCDIAAKVDRLLGTTILEYSDSNTCLEHNLGRSLLVFFRTIFGRRRRGYGV